jgi:hypothetical protein
MVPTSGVLIVRGKRWAREVIGRRRRSIFPREGRGGSGTPVQEGELRRWHSASFPADGGGRRPSGQQRCRPRLPAVTCLVQLEEEGEDRWWAGPKDGLAWLCGPMATKPTQRKI